MKTPNRLFLFFLLLLVGISVVQADLGDDVAGLVSSLGLESLFSRISYTSGDIVRLTPFGFGFVRFFLAILVGAVYYWGLSKLFKGNKGITTLVTVPLALLSILAMPQSWVEKIFITTGWIIPLLVWGGIFVVGNMITKQFRDTPAISGLVTIVMAICLFFLTDVISKVAATVSESNFVGWLSSILWFAAIIYLFKGIFSLFGSLGGGGRKYGHHHHHRRSGGGLFGRAAGGMMGAVGGRMSDEWSEWRQGRNSAKKIKDLTNAEKHEDQRLVSVLFRLYTYLHNLSEEGYNRRIFFSNRKKICKYVAEQAQNMLSLERSTEKVVRKVPEILPDIEPEGDPSILREEVRSVKLTEKELAMIKSRAGYQGLSEMEREELEARALESKQQHLQNEIKSHENKLKELFDEYRREDALLKQKLEQLRDAAKTKKAERLQLVTLTNEAYQIERKAHGKLQENEGEITEILKLEEASSEVETKELDQEILLADTEFRTRGQAEEENIRKAEALVQQIERYQNNHISEDIRIYESLVQLSKWLKELGEQVYLEGRQQINQQLVARMDLLMQMEDEGKTSRRLMWNNLEQLDKECFEPSAKLTKKELEELKSTKQWKEAKISPEAEREELQAYAIEKKKSILLKESDNIRSKIHKEFSVLAKLSEKAYRYLETVRKSASENEPIKEIIADLDRAIVMKQETVKVAREKAKPQIDTLRQDFEKILAEERSVEGLVHEFYSTAQKEVDERLNEQRRRLAEIIAQRARGPPPPKA